MSEFAPVRDWPTDIHVHIQPWERMRPAARAAIERSRDDLDLIRSLQADPLALVEWLDRERIGRIAVINYVAPDIMGFQSDVNPWCASYRDRAKGRVLAFGGIHPPTCRDIESEMKYLLQDLKLDGIKIHPPHQNLGADAYRTGECPSLAKVYEACAEAKVPVMFHTGTSVFPGARSRLGDALVLDDVAIDFPTLPIIMAHGGRPLWSEQAFFVMRRHKNVWLDLSGIPPKSILESFPRLAEIGDRVLFGTDWPSPGVKSIRKNLDEFLGLPLTAELLDRVTRTNALRLFPIT